MSAYYHAAPCTRLADDPVPGVRLMRGGEDQCRCGEYLNRLSPAEARTLGADLILAANTSDAQWDAPGPRARDSDNDHRFDSAGTDGYEL
jgi:hypothetical protein